ncbi:hypothetical protein [Pandoravirus japonicus]|uniref:Uncharacterized protein n=1 Tax=Pandoravirus japonicus TaxID=2823154 RepID=A0A811BME0_9VIRU|nr:hypothetical protein [Pandoravirus japonicus]
MRRGNRPRSTRPAAAQPPARTAATGLVSVPPAWDAVRQWAADNGLNSVAALQRWLDSAAVRRAQYPSLDPRAAALLRALQQYALTAPVADRPLEGTARLPSQYDALLGALSDPSVGSFASGDDGRAHYVPGIGGPDWIRPLVDPLAEGGRLWPPSPVTTLVRLNEVVSRVFGHGPVDSDATILDLTDRYGVLPGRSVGDRLAALLGYFGSEANWVLRGMGDARVDIAATPRLASDADISEARRRWPAVSPDGVVAPYVFVVGPGSAQDPSGAWTAATGPVHVAFILSGYTPIGRLVVSDTTGDIVDATEVFSRPEASNTAFGKHLMAEASGSDPSLVVGLLMPFVRAVREGRPDAVAMAPTRTNIAGSGFWTTDQGMEQPFTVRAFEPAQVLAGLAAERRAAAASAIDAATAAAGGLANLAARAYRGDIATANAPEEVRQLAAAHAMARACGPGATLQDRARIADAAQVLGLPDDVRAQDLETICDASADAVRRLYGRA